MRRSAPPGPINLEEEGAAAAAGALSRVFFYVPQYEPPQIRQYSSRVTNFFFEFRIRIPVFESSKSAAVY